jgi:hypothetical protein
MLRRTSLVIKAVPDGRKYNPMTFPEEWAFIQYNLGVSFMRNHDGKDLSCIDNSIYHLENAAQVWAYLPGPWLRCPHQRLLSKGLHTGVSTKNVCEHISVFGPHPA